MFHVVIRALLRFIPRRFKSILYEKLAKASARRGGELYVNIYRFPLKLVLKRSISNTPNEANGLRVAGSLHGVYTPLLIDYVSTGVCSYTLMSWIDGDCCVNVWKLLTPSDKVRIASELRVQIGIMRQCTTGRSSSICAVAGGPMWDPRVPWFGEEGRIVSSPSDFFKEVWLGLNFPHLHQTIAPAIQPLIDRGDVPIVFCHGDILPKNLILPGGLSRWRSGTTPVHLIDWEYSGWMPLPWEALKATWLVFKRDGNDWYEMMQDVFPESLPELEADWLWRTKSNIPIV